jgi:hypothetical protein
MRRSQNNHDENDRHRAAFLRRALSDQSENDRLKLFRVFCNQRNMRERPSNHLCSEFPFVKPKHESAQQGSPRSIAQNPQSTKLTDCVARLTTQQQKKQV